MPRLQRRLLTYPDPIPSSNSLAHPKIRFRFPSIHTMPTGNIFVPLLFRETTSRGGHKPPSAVRRHESPHPTLPICAGAQMGIAQPREASPAWYPGAKRRQSRRKSPAMGKRHSFYSFSSQNECVFYPQIYPLPLEKPSRTSHLGGQNIRFRFVFFQKTNTLTVRYNMPTMEEEK
jgi:hypothetical protein